MKKSMTPKVISFILLGMFLCSFSVDVCADVSWYYGFPGSGMDSNWSTDAPNNVVESSGYLTTGDGGSGGYGNIIFNGTPYTIIWSYDWGIEYSIRSSNEAYADFGVFWGNMENTVLSETDAVLANDTIVVWLEGSSRGDYCGLYENGTETVDYSDSDIRLSSSFESRKIVKGTNPNGTFWFAVYQQGTLEANHSTTINWSSSSGKNSLEYLGIYSTHENADHNWDIDWVNITIYNDNINISGVYCTSPVPDDYSEPYTTQDITPTFKFNTNTYADCRISNEDLSYSSMSVNCTEGQGTKNHTCTLHDDDALSGVGTKYVYVSCKNGIFEHNSSNNRDLEMYLAAANESAASEAIQSGILASSIWPGATVYTDQQVYLRDLSNNQTLATVDKVAVYGNQRWLFSYTNASKLGLFNITPVVYVLDLVNLTESEIQYKVINMIDSTKN